jgi:hypothetical protein
MVASANWNRTSKSRAGIALLAIGLALMLAKVGWIAVGLDRLAADFCSLDFPAATALLLLQLSRALAFGHALIFSVAGNILVLCFALAVVVTGLLLILRRRSA